MSTLSSATAAEVFELLRDDLSAIEREFSSQSASNVAVITDIAQYLIAGGGKRIRPLLLLLSAKALGCTSHSRIRLGAVVEMLHTATLVHDDVLDEATTRRHVATINSRWNNETSVLLGDYLFTHAFHLASSLDSALACRLIGRATNLVCEGELCQIHERGNLDLTEEQYFEIIDGKTAELCALCCFLGGYYAEASETVTKSLQNYGRSLGIAFQIADDLLDVLGSEEMTGKSLGSDFKKQKLTLPLIRLLATAAPQDATRIRELLAHPDEASQVELERWLERSDAIAYTRARANEFAASARENLSSLPESPARHLLEELTEFVTQRST